MRRLSVLGLCLFVFIQCNINPPMEKETYRFHPLRLKPGADLKGEIEEYLCGQSDGFTGEVCQST
jgi:hypothetical protein